jgi:hypothetical protein
VFRYGANLKIWGTAKFLKQEAIASKPALPPMLKNYSQKALPASFVA